MDIKPYDLALYVGRFQPLHLGHCSVIDTALKIADRVLIFVGSSQESGTILNPFNVDTRISIIKEIYGDKVTVKPLLDLEDKEDMSKWTKYLLDEVIRYEGKLPDLCIFGDEKSNGWFTDDEMKETMRIVMPRQRLPISATKIREYILRNDRQNWVKYSHPKTHKHWSDLRTELLSCEPYKKALDKLYVRQSKGWSDYDVRDNIMEGQIDFD